LVCHTFLSSSFLFLIIIGILSESTHHLTFGLFRQVWSSATESFDIADISITITEDNQVIFGPKLMKGMEGRVVTGVKCKWDPEDDSLMLKITIKLGRWVPGFDITCKAKGVNLLVGEVKEVEGKGVARVRPY
jgi:hypothetical protein